MQRAWEWLRLLSILLTMPSSSELRFPLTKRSANSGYVATAAYAKAKYRVRPRAVSKACSKIDRNRG